ncbi:MAG: tRNA (N6-threonylcarbamoyladenosine(37)-N6)-methyltransferase TrmO [Verrucomicrobiota bacterium]|jgi:tRNA-Thr(GGU) m(6)t(6)A37 methyltransferase TsaA
MKLKPIGTIHSSYQQATGTPIQSACAVGVKGTVEVFPEYALGLRDLDGFDRIWLLYWFDRAKPAQLIVTPYLDTTPHGVFATRAPCRPNPIGLSVVRLLGVTGHCLDVEGVDVLDNTPLLDIKPYIPAFDWFQTERVGWCGHSQSNSAVADNRFETDEHA